MVKKHATEFEKIINADRNRKQKEALAARIFSRDRRSSAPGKQSGASSPAAGSLASRVGVTKKQNRASSGAAGVNGVWFHDLNGSSAEAAPSSLASRVTTPGVPTGPKRQQQQRATRLASALSRDQARAPAQQQANVKTLRAAAANNNNNNANIRGSGPGISIRGLAGPLVIMAQNFAPGTTAADIESAFTPFGGIITSCRLLKTSPIIIAEIIFEDPNGAQRVIDQFNGQMADGRLLRVYAKVGDSGPSSAAGPLRDSNAHIVDGSLGFAGGDYDGMDVENGNGGAGGDRKLYSDSLLLYNSASTPRTGGYSRRGRGNNGASGR